MAHEMGGWSRGKDSDVNYNHGLELKHYTSEQKKVSAWLKGEGYFDQ
jgi:hypothetical protein